MAAMLTEEQEKLISVVRDEYLQRYFSLEFDEEKARELMNFVYKMHGFKKPAIRIVNSPYACQSCANSLNKNVRGWRIGAWFWRQIWSRMWGQLKRHIKQQLWQQTERQLEQHVGHQLTQQIWSRIMAWIEAETQPWLSQRLWRDTDFMDLPFREWHRMELGIDILTRAWEELKQIEERIEEQIEIKAGRQIIRPIWQQTHDRVMEPIKREIWRQTGHRVMQEIDRQRQTLRPRRMKSFAPPFGLDATDYAWVAYLDYFTRVGVVDKNELFEEYKELITANIFYCLTFENVAVISRPPKFIKVDDSNRLHSVDGPAVQFNDGRKLHFVHGVYFQPYLFKTAFTHQDLTHEELIYAGINNGNAEQRAAIIKEYGYENFMSGAKVLDVYRGLSKIDNGHVVYRLLEFEVDRLTVRVIELEDHTQHKKTMLSVPRTEETENCIGAIAWTFGMSKAEYQPMLES